MMTLTPYPLWLFFLVAGLCIVLVGIAKAGFGGGVGVLATPLMSLVVSPLVAAGLLLPLLCLCDVVSLWPYRKNFDRRSLVHLLPGAVAGIALGTLFLWCFRTHKEDVERALRLSIGAISILFVVYQMAHRWILRRTSQSVPGAVAGTVLGVVAGVASMLAHAGGPPVTIYMIRQPLERQRFVGTTVVFFFTVNFIKLLPYGYLGMLQLSNLKVSLWLAPLVPVGVGLGLFLNRRLSQRLFGRIIYVILFLTGLQLLSGVNLIDLAMRMAR